MAGNDNIRQQVEQNYQAFEKLLPKIPNDRLGKFALMRDEKIIEYFDSAPDAVKFAELKYDDGLFSVQEVTKRIVDLGYFSHAIAI